MARKALLLTNLGTPSAPDTASVRRYLRELLSDPLVMDLRPIRRKLLLELLILPFRSPRSARAYRSVWTERGSPLVFHGEDLARGVAEILGGDWQVEISMRYGEPSIEGAMKSFAASGVAEIVSLPLYPQEAASTRTSAVEALRRAIERVYSGRPAPALKVLPPFFEEPGYIEALAEVTGPVIEENEPDHVLMSFHGLPERHIRRSDPTGSYCLEEADCCLRRVAANEHCYRAQSHRTAFALAEAMGLGGQGEGWSLSFQSRMGRTPWIGPHTSEVVQALARRKVRRLVVVCPSFVADCLETIEEIGMRARELFEEAGGESFTLAPCLNSSPRWVEAVASMARRGVEGR